jgi:bifunctional DNA-binding transcriptional regulator/antitoxin component of YhaV-PrlF toxin-antitoxin module
MKILKVKSRNYKGKQYYKFRINLPSEDLEKAGFKEGDELEINSKNGEIKLVKEKRPYNSK